MGEKKIKDKLFAEFPPVKTKEWKSVVEKDLKGSDFDKTVVWKTYEGFDVQPFYRKEDIDISKSSPGEFPYIRGNKTEQNTWLINENINELNPKKANSQAINSINNGAGSITFDSAVIKDKEDLESLLNKIDTEKIEINFTKTEDSKKFLSLLIKYGKSRQDKLKGCYFFDPLKDLALNGHLNETIFKDLKQSITLFNEVLPDYKLFTVHSYHFKSSGGNIVQEVAFSLSSAVEYITRLSELGFNIDFISSKLAFSFSVSSNFFMEVAKLRAARLLWANIIKQYKPKDNESLKMYVHTHTAHFNKTIYDPHINILRGATETMAAAIGGANSITVMPFDYYYKNPDQFSKRISRNSQLVIREEAYLDKVIDPGAGSYYIETLTNSIANESLKLFQKIEKSGGFVKELRKGTIQSETHKNRKYLEKNIQTAKEVFLGTNKYPNNEETIFKKISKSNVNPESINKFETLKPQRGSEIFEELRLATERSRRKPPKVFLLQLGNVAMRNARANFTRNFFGCASFEVIDNSGFETVEVGVKAALNSKSEIVVICSSNHDYLEIVPKAVKKLRSANPKIKIIVAGYSKKLLENLQCQKIDDFIYARSNMIEILSKYQKLFGIGVN